MNRGKLKIRATSPLPRDWRVWIDDLEITAGLTGLTVQIDADDVSTAELRMFVDELDIDAETVMVLHAVVEAKA